jgi:hypothetical protein
MLSRADALRRRYKFYEAMELILSVRAVAPDDDVVESLLLRNSAELLELCLWFSGSVARQSVLRKYEACFDRAQTPHVWQKIGTEQMRRRGLVVTEDEISEMIRVARLFKLLVQAGLWLYIGSFSGLLLGIIVPVHVVLSILFAAILTTALIPFSVMIIRRHEAFRKRLMGMSRGWIWRR